MSLATGPAGPLDPAADADHEEEMEADDAEDDEDGEARDLPAASTLVSFNLLLRLLLFQQGRQDQLQSLGVNVPGEMFYSPTEELDANSIVLTFSQRNQPAKCFF